MEQASAKDWAELFSQAVPLLNRIGVDLLLAADDYSDLPSLVALVGGLEELTALARAHGEEKTFQFAYAIEKIVSGILCERFDAPASVMEKVDSAVALVKNHIETLGGEWQDDNPEASEKRMRDTVEDLFALLDTPVASLNGKQAPAPPPEAPRDQGKTEPTAAAPALPPSASAQAPDLVARIESGLREVGLNSSDLPGLVAVMELLDELRGVAEQTADQTLYRFAFAMGELLSGVLCERFEDPDKILRVIDRHLDDLRNHASAQGKARGETARQAAAAIESFFEILDVPIVDLPGARSAASAIFVDGIAPPEFRGEDDTDAEGDKPDSIEASPIEAPAPDVAPPADGFDIVEATGLPETFDDIDIYREFAYESQEHLETVEENLLDLEASPDDTNLINQIFRPIHSIKGGAGFLSLKGVNKLAHDTETLLDRCRKGEIPVTSETVEICLRSVDALKQMITNLLDAVESSSPESKTFAPVPFGKIRADIRDIIGADRPAPGAKAPSPTPSKTPVAADSPLAPAPASDAIEDATYASTGLPKSIDSPEDESLLKRFVLQCNEHLETIEEDILSLEKNPDDEELVNGIFRAFHSIKGDAGFLYLEAIGSLAHDTETLLDRLRTGKIKASTRAVQLCLDSVDALKQMIGNLSELLNEPDPSAALASAEYPPVVFGPIRNRIQKFLETPEAPPRIGDILIEEGAITEEQLRDALQMQNAPVGEVLSRMGAVESGLVDRALEKQKQAGGAGSSGSAKAFKVDTEKIDSLVNLVGELVIIEAQVARIAQTLDGENQAQAKNIAQLSKITKELQDRAMTLRMMPIRQTFQKMMRLVRDASKKMGKQVQLVMSGEDTELDKTVVEQIGDPLVHMLRNCVDHGIESPADRAQSGKPLLGTVHLSAFYQGDRIKIRVRDDGQGLNRERIVKKAIESGLLPPGANPPDSEVFSLIFAPGFSTAQKVTDISGRGVGMDVVRRNIEKLRGSVDVESQQGKGTTITISLPLTLAIIDGMVVRVGSEEFIIPTIAIQESIQPRPEAISTVAGRGELVSVRGELCPLIRLYDMWGIEPKHVDPCEALVVIVKNDGRSGCLMVDELVGQQQIVIKNLGSRFSNVRGVMGATILGNGQVGLILDVDGVLIRALGD